MKNNISVKILIVFFIFLNGFNTTAQEDEYAIPDEAIQEDLGSYLWMGSYNKIRVGERLVWDAQLHYRRGNYNDVPFVGRMAQIYNRHALTYVFNPAFNASVGGVLRLDFTPTPGDETIENLILEPRIWHQYMFIMPFGRVVLAHRLRVEHRWSRGFDFDSKYIFRNRFRYKINASIPLNKPKLEPGAFYFTPDIEVILQSGKTIVDNPLEDLRIYPQLGYIFSKRLKVGGGLMYTTGQSSNPGGFQYRRRFVIRINAYISLDFRKFENKLPQINLTD